jgi:hypothetical protein
MNTFLTISLWIMAVLYVWSTLRMIANIGKPRKPASDKPGIIAGAVLVQAFFITVMVLSALALAS